MQKLNENIMRLSLWVVMMATFVLLINPNANAETTTAEPVPVTAEVGPDGVQHLSITLDSYSFSPAYIVVQSGKPVELTLKNVATVAPHNIKIDAVADGLFVSQDVEPGQTATVQFTPTKAGIYEFYCDKKLAFFPSHRKKGMIGKLEAR